MQIEIIGAGAIGLLLAGALGEAGHQIRLWTRTNEQADQINEYGIEWSSSGLPVRSVKSGISALPVTPDWSSREGQGDWVILTVKQRHLTDSFIKALKGLTSPSTPVLCFQNGMGHLQRLAEGLQSNLIFAAVTTEGGKRPAPNRVVRSLPGETRLGSLFLEDLSRLEFLADILRKAGVKAFVSKDIEREIHRKLLINAAINPLTAIWRIPNGELLASKGREELLDRLISEGITVYASLGIPFEPDIREQIKEVCRATSGNISSMLADVLREEQTEVDFINGYLVGIAAKTGVAVPTHEMVWRLVQGLQPSES